MSYRIDWEAAGVVATLTETLHGIDLAGMVTEICGDTRFDELKYCIVDTTNVARVAVDEEHVLGSAASLIGAAFSNARVVVTVVSTLAESHAICGKLCEARAMPFLPAVFPDVRMARRWIQSEIPFRKTDAACAEMKFRPTRD
jgi:hypothetical protein